ncbi:Condensin subunit 1/Condensin-2 complex subunit D3 protein [Dioscorea alata]|uniref:Condensin subunit 1/Condensin-2 complex subunit D3 protein n=1 Tax=Dioscorea alata TaxID=55571 RepID=A0ACB7V1F4_DIOAL|nr:Condensin subunit 1/Condensin-2 complex subunit D3 protein [Dioscorea alata]
MQDNIISRPNPLISKSKHLCFPPSQNTPHVSSPPSTEKMAPSFTFPSDLHSSDESDSGDHLLSLSSPIDLSSLRPFDLEELVKGVAFDLSEKEIFCVEEQQVFDRVYSLVKGFSHLNSSCKFNLAETLRSNLSVLLPNLDSLSRAAPSSPSGYSGVAARVSSHRNALKIYTFFLLSIALGEQSRHEHPVGGSKAAVQSKKKNHLNSWNWESYRGRIINLIANSLEINLSLLFGSSEIDENYLSFVSRCVFTLYENQTLLKDSDSRESLGRIIGAIATKYHQTTQACASILHLLHKFDFAVTHIADAVAAAENKYGDGRLAVAIIREIGRADPKDYSRDGVGAENVGRFLVELADRSPKLVSMNVGVLVPHFGGESYKIRNALVSVLGKLVMKAFRDIEGDVSSKSLRLRGKQAMLEILIERCRDVSAYTRSRVLQVWAELCEEHAVSIGLWNEVASVASGRLEDKSAMVRKSALNLLISMLQHNPFGPQLRVAAFEATLEKYKEKLCQMEPSAISEDGNGVDAVHGQAPMEEHEESVSDSCPPHGDEQREEEAIVPDIGNLEQIRALVASLEAGLRFAKCITSTMVTLVQLLASSSVTDVEYTILLLMRCKQFQIDGSEACLRKMLPLVFSQDKSIYEAVENAFITIYIRKDPEETAKNLLNLALDSSIGDLAALECLVSSLVSKGEISTSMMSALWNFFSFNSNGVIAAQSRGALSILCMALKSTPGILGSHLQDIVDIGFGRWAKEEPLLARTACVALDRLSDEDKQKLRCGGIKIFSMLQSLLTGSWLPENVWYAAADKAIKAIYSIHPTPEIFAAEVVKTSISSIFSSSGNDEMPTDADSEDVNVSTVLAAKLGRCLFIISHVAFNQLVYIESCIHKLQKQKAKKEKSKLESEAAAGFSTEASEKQNINAELGLGASEDAAIDALSERAEKEIVSGVSNEKNLIGHCATFLSKLCRNFNLLQKFPDLQASAMLALCRLMIIDADFCEANLQLLFTVVENAPSETVRSNCTLSLGDLAVRFPNLLEPWTENIYARLRDPSVSVRKNAVLVLSHLILNDMMKVKGYINEMAMRIEDEEGRISNLARLFFHELSKKGSNPIYNLLPDILGRLSDQKNMKKDSFRNIMQFLINSIKKDKQMEALVEKLCNRFSGVSDKTQWECIVYCLSQLTFTEKGMKKLMESFKTYEHVLLEDSVVDHFKNIISKSKKFAKPELKSCIDEFEEKLNKSHMERKEQEEIANNAYKHQQKIERSMEDGTGEVINPAEEATSNTTEAIQPDANGMNSEESCGCSILTECDDEDTEFQSPKASHGGDSDFIIL